MVATRKRAVGKEGSPAAKPAHRAAFREKTTAAKRAHHDAFAKAYWPHGDLPFAEFLEIRKALLRALKERRLGTSAINGIIGRKEQGTFHIDGDPRYAMRWRIWSWTQRPASVQDMTPKIVLLGELQRKFDAHGPNWDKVKFLGGDFPRSTENDAEAAKVLAEFKASVGEAE